MYRVPRLPLACLSTMLCAAPAFAATITVDSTTDDPSDTTSCTLRDAVTAATNDAVADGCTAGSGNDVISLPTGTYTITEGTVVVTSVMSIEGAGSGSTVVMGELDSRAFRVNSGGDLTLSDLDVTNFRGQYGGALYNSAGTLTLRRVACYGNTATQNGGCLSAESTTGVEDSLIYSNNASNIGGGIELFTGAVVTITDTWIHSNIATSHGGAIGSTGNGPSLTMLRSALTGNTSGGNGGAILEDGGNQTITITNSTISGNVASNSGGGLNSQAAVSLSHVTITENQAATGGGMVRGGGAWRVVNSIIANNDATTGPDCNINSVNTERNNLIGDSTDCSAFSDSSDLLDVDPFLASLADNGGSTLSHMPASQSPARGGADCLDTTSAVIADDQRGYPRPADGICTMGSIAAGLPFQVLIETTILAAGAECTNGGYQLSYGLDLDLDGVLDANEITATENLCNGDDGTDGTDGTNGSDGAEGSDGHDSLVTVTAEAAGANCANGGQRIDAGLDADGDGVLDAGEITNTQYVCNGADGNDGSDGNNGSDGYNALVALTVEAAGSNCTSGGQRIDTGLDTDGNGVLDVGEITETQYVCNGSAGADGHNALVTLTPEPAGANCAEGGQKLEVGIDISDDGVLDAGEIIDTQYLCAGATGANGRDAIVLSTPEPAGANCAQGGQRLDIGIDGDNDGILDQDEIIDVEYVCHGEHGADGTNGNNGDNGLNSLVSVRAEPAGANCTAGGQAIEVGLDLNGDRLLQAEEVAGIEYICNPEASGGCQASGNDPSGPLGAFLLLLPLLAARRLADHTRRI